ncbi:hypothetical protein AB0910_21860 [Streptomyces sp. NPDC047002]|uniref:hypothetical protein n=1 Tax=Streptomyces sp. NPDC047002 TaxID=3155475 RepID=UPI00345376C4
MRVWRAVGAVGVVVGVGAGVLGCGGGGGDRAQKTVSAAAVCGGALSPQAAKSLDFLMGSKEYLPSSGSDADLTGAATELRDGYVAGVDAEDLDVKPATACAVPDLRTVGTSDLRVQFSFATAQEADRKTFSEHVRYGIGRNAFVNSDWAYLYFDCVSPRLKGSTEKQPAIVESVLSNAALSQHRSEPDGTRRKIDEANLSVLNSVALKVAGKLQCADNGGLTSDPALRPADGA